MPSPTTRTHPQQSAGAYTLLLPQPDQAGEPMLSAATSPASVGADELLGLVTALLPLGTAGVAASSGPANDEAVVPLMLAQDKSLSAGLPWQRRFATRGRRCLGTRYTKRPGGRSLPSAQPEIGKGSGEIPSHTGEMVAQRPRGASGQLAPDCGALPRREADEFSEAPPGRPGRGDRIGVTAAGQSTDARTDCYLQ